MAKRIGSHLKGISMALKKLFILDTNVLVHDPQAMFSFSPEIVGIPIIVLEELDNFKTESSQRGASARAAIRTLDGLRSRGSLGTGVQLDKGGTLQVLFLVGNEHCTDLVRPDTPDNQILYIALCMQKKGHEVVLVSKDINVRVRADALGLIAVDYLKNTISQDEYYRGWIRLQVPAVQLKKDFPEELGEYIKTAGLERNEYVLLESQHNEFNYRLFRYIGGGKFKAIIPPQLHWSIAPRNPQQLIALDLLLDDSIQLVTLAGPAGTGKTFLALVAALHKLLIEKKYIKILISRPVIPLGPDIGYLPGDIKEKLHSWMQPIYDNMDFIAHTANAAKEGDVRREAFTDQAGQNRRDNRPSAGLRISGRDDREGHDRKRNRDNHDRRFPTLEELESRGKISLEAITYMRGRSIPYQYIFIDEVQNLTPHEVKTIVSRVGEGSKIVLAGDPYQIDSPYLDFTSNGLMVASEKFKGQPIFGTAFLETSERSELSRLAGELL
jgi:Predicted ATPase related to phosphate starvation-inducible protein PhoH